MNEKRTTMNGKPVFSVPAKSVVNFESGFKEKQLCDGPTFTAGTSCPYSCSFCYVPDQMRKQGPWLSKHGVEGKHQDIVIRRTDAAKIAIGQILSRSSEERCKKKVIYASPLTDVAANMELLRETIEIVQGIMRITNWDVRLLSKSNLLPKVAQGLGVEGMGRVIYGVSTGTLDDKLAAAFEEGCPLVSKRIQSLHWLQDNGYRTFGMICPSLPVPDYDIFSFEMAKALRVEKLEHVWAEVINVRGESFVNTARCLRAAGFVAVEDAVTQVSQDKDLWENYSRATFNAHKKNIPAEKLKFLQYVTKANEAWWAAEEKNGAVLLHRGAVHEKPTAEPEFNLA